MQVTVWQTMGSNRRWRRDVEFEATNPRDIALRLKKEGFYPDDLSECDGGFTFTDMRQEFFVEVVE